MVEGSQPAVPFRKTPGWVYLCVAMVFIVGTGLRFIDLTDPPLDYFPQRQLRGAIIARGIYYQLLPSADPAERQQAVYLADTMDPREPSVFEGLVAVTYLLTGGENLWVARIYAILFWVLGGVALYLLARRLTSPLAAIIPLAYYFFLPWSIIFSRIFQPDLIMVMLTLWVAYTLYRWSDTPSWKWAIPSGVLAGLAVFIKLPAIFPIGLILLGITLVTFGFKKTITSLQFWIMLVLFLAPGTIYYLFVIPSSSNAWLSSTLPLIKNWISPSFYIRWLIFAGGLVDLGIAFISFVGIWLLPAKKRIIPLALWLGYILYGLAFPYYITTHEYYSIPLIPAIALSLAPLAGVVFKHISDLGRLTKYALAGIVVFSLAYSGWMGRSILLSKNYRNEAIAWQNMRQGLPPTGDLIGITHEQGYRIAYYGWRHVTPWPYTPQDEQALSGDDPQAGFQALFTNYVKGQDYFVVTLFSEFKNHPLLNAYLNDHYAVYKQGDGYLVFDLTQPKAGMPR
jgi:hypothetical protein